MTIPIQIAVQVSASLCTTYISRAKKAEKMYGY